MVQYATASELACYLQKDLDTASAVQALTLASADFSGAADTWFTATTTTWSTIYAHGCWELELPFRPVTSVSAVRVNGVVITGWTLRCGFLYRLAGFGYRYTLLPDQVDVDLTYGYAAVPDDVKLATLEIAAGLFDNPTGVVSEAIDDYTVRYNGTPIVPGRPWRDVAASYRGLLIS
jgi:hypothetical protein